MAQTMRDNPNFEHNLKKLKPRDLDRANELERIEREAIANFHGPLDELFGAIGMLRMGDHFGWRVLVLIHNKRTIRKYEAILDIKVRYFFPEEGAASERSVGYTIVKKIGNFWKAVSGDIKIDQRRELSES